MFTSKRQRAPLFRATDTYAAGFDDGDAGGEAAQIRG
jgi:hypothetical protein